MAVINFINNKQSFTICFSERKNLTDKSPDEKKVLLENTNYSQKAINLYINKINLGQINNAEVNLAYTGPCGDTCKIFLKINDQNVIEDAKFQYLGCIGCAACGSIVTQIVKNMTLQNAKRINEHQIIEELGGLPGDECHCATLVLKTLRKTINKFEKSKK